MNPGFRITNSNFLSNRDFNILAAVLELKKKTLYWELLTQLGCIINFIHCVIYAVILAE